jgi:hypothetical protein
MNKKTDLTSTEGLPTSDDFPDRARRVRDIDLGSWLGYSDPSNCRELIRKKIKAGNRNDSDILRAEREHGQGAKRAATASVCTMQGPTRIL